LIFSLLFVMFIAWTSREASDVHKNLSKSWLFIVLIWNIQSPHEDNLLSCEMYKIITWNQKLWAAKSREAALIQPFPQELRISQRRTPVMNRKGPWEGYRPVSLSWHGAIFGLFKPWKRSICSIILLYALLTLGRQVNGSKFAKPVVEMAAKESRILSNRRRPWPIYFMTRRYRWVLY